MDKLYIWLYDNGIYYFGYLILIIAGLYTAKTIIEAPFRAKMYEFNYRLRKIQTQKARQPMDQREYKNQFLNKLQLLLRTTGKEQAENQLLSFFVITGFLFLFGCAFVFMTLGDLFISIVVGCLAGIIPYLLLQVKLRKIRFLMGNELLNIIQILTQHYNAVHFDMYHALVETQKEIKDPALRKVFLKLISELQVSRNETDIRNTIQVFVYASGTNWTKRLGNIILKSYLNSQNVLNALLALTKQIEETEEMLEQEKSKSMDSIANGYLTLLIFPLSLVLGYFSSGPQDWFDLQFKHEGTMFLFNICVIGVVFSVLIAKMLSRPKNDI